MLQSYWISSCFLKLPSLFLPQSFYTYQFLCLEFSSLALSTIFCIIQSVCLYFICLAILLKQKLLAHIIYTTAFMKLIWLGFISLFLIYLNQLCICQLHASRAQDLFLHLLSQKVFGIQLSTQYIFDEQTGGWMDGSMTSRKQT